MKYKTMLPTLQEPGISRFGKNGYKDCLWCSCVQWISGQ